MKALYAGMLALAALVVSAAADPNVAAVQSGTEIERCGKCGDGYCATSCENETTCPADCGADSLAAKCGKCGDGYCAAQCGETATSCPTDCLGTPM